MNRFEVVTGQLGQHTVVDMEATGSGIVQVFDNAEAAEELCKKLNDEECGR